MLAVGSPLDALAGRLLQAHMTQHMLLMMVAPLLLWLGAPVAPVLRGLPRPIRRGVAAGLAALQSGVAGSLSSGLHHARRERGDGYCTFNGLAIAAGEALTAGAASVLYPDRPTPDTVLATMRHAHTFGLSFDVVDALTLNGLSGDEERLGIDTAIEQDDLRRRDRSDGANRRGRIRRRVHGARPSRATRSRIALSRKRELYRRATAC